MAKIKFNLVELQGKIGNLVFVNSKTYGTHVRLPRGTHTKATINNILKQNAANAATVTQTARCLHQAFKKLCGPFKQKDLWQVMLSRMFKAEVMTIPYLIACLNGLEMNAAYPLQQLTTIPLFTTTFKRRQLMVVLQTAATVQFTDSLHADSYFMELTAIWLNKDGNRQETASQATEWIPLNGDAFSFELLYTPPTWASSYLLLLKMQAGKGGNTIEQFKATGMRVVATGAC
ncbi:hypothetical protein FC093_16500 [Ilyomonas limi]|uniref:Uncharacterized protein n=1 Tax=Ilyomonas limi TaxID=2575867 RepID=A0A4U3KZM1_9BACT|nr:hypothetical protein [Ilyomonas limi]TKK66636.1 hypothetical protein FC093_16500 [Ilyomonas limi]